MNTRNELESVVQTLKEEIEQLRASYRETSDVVKAIHDGEVDAVVVRPSEQKHAVYTFFGEDHPYRLLVEAMTEGAVTVSTDGTVLYCNPSFARMMGTSPESVVGLSFGHFMSPADLSRFQAFLAMDGSNRAEMTLVSNDGVRVPAYLSRSVADLVGVRGICMVVTDLTERKKLDDVVASERLALTILDQASEAIIVCDEAGRITHASREAFAICGQNPLYKPFDEVFNFSLALESGHSPADEAHARGDKKILKDVASGKKRMERQEVVITGPAGEDVHLLVSSSPLEGDSGQVLGAVLILANVTSARRAAEAIRDSERKLRVANETLEERVAERTQELASANERLRKEIKQRKVLEREVIRSGEAERRRLGQELHDGLQGDLFGISLVSAQLARDLRELGSDQADRADMMTRLLKDSIANTRRLASQIWPVEITPEGLEDALRQLVCGITEVSNLPCQLETHGNAKVESSEVAIHLFRIAQEAVNNAVKHSRASTITVRLTAEGDQGTLSIEDDGVGIAEEKLNESGGMGINNMQYRADLINGKIAIEAGRKGTIVTCQFPTSSVQATTQNGRSAE